jgi:putative aldouronate transport system substrate-binding protein
MTDPRVDRRTLLRGAAVAAGLAASGGLLAGCGDGKVAGNGDNTGVKLPTYRPYQHWSKPDLAGANGVPDGYLKYPASPVRAAKSAPGDGSTVSGFVQTYSPIAPGLGSNKYWQALDKTMNVKLDMSVVAAADYTDKLNTLIAGGDLPDLVQIRGIPNELPNLLAAKFADLSPYLAGDAAAEYPFLANIPSVFWQTSCVYNGGIYGLQVPRSTMGGVTYRRDDMIAAKGLDPDPASYADFQKLCADLTDTRHNRWALANADAAFYLIQQMMGVPNAWRNENGKLTNTAELPETRQALDATAKLVKAGYVHPDSFGSATQDLTTNYKQWFNAGSAVIDGDNYTAWPQWYVQNVAGSGFRVGGLLPPNYDSGSKAVTWQGTPAFSFTAFKKAGAKRLKALLKLCDWIAAPFGTAEYLLRAYGVEGVDWTFKDGDPVPTTEGNAEVPGLSVRYIADSPQVLYYPGQSRATRDAFAFIGKALPRSVADPTIGLYSATNAAKASLLANQLTDARHAVMRGQQPLSSWDDAVRTWRTSGGDAVRTEFEKALQKRG